jgi:hypothetical protein
MVHVDAAAKAAVATLKVMAAPTAPEFDGVAEKVLVPHPLAEGVAKVPKVKLGNVILTSSWMASSKLAVNVYSMCVLTSVSGFRINIVLTLVDGTGALPSLGMTTTAIEFSCPMFSL